MQNNKEILDELAAIGVSFNGVKMPKQTLPDNYFNNLNQDIKSTIFIEDLPKNTPYHLPDGYITDFKVRLPKGKIVAMTGYIKWSIAAMFILFIGAGSVMPQFTSTSNTIIADSKITPESALEYINNNIEEFSTEELTANNSALQEDVLPATLNAVNTTELNNYILENNLNDI
jgi:hypothetical protein